MNQYLETFTKRLDEANIRWRKSPWTEDEDSIDIPFTSDWQLFYTINYGENETKPEKFRIILLLPQAKEKLDQARLDRKLLEDTYFNGYSYWGNNGLYRGGPDNITISRKEFQFPDVQTALKIFSNFVRFIDEKVWPALQPYL